MKYIISLLLLIGISVTSLAQSCKDLPNRFDSYSEAITAINDADFSYTDKLPQGKSSWITEATFYSCDGRTGYMVYTTSKGGEYIHEGVPKSVWNEFKTAPSSGSYYDYNIKRKYRLVPQ